MSPQVTSIAKNILKEINVGTTSTYLPPKGSLLM
jgi:hypothetical protein